MPGEAERSLWLACGTRRSPTRSARACGSPRITTRSPMWARYLPCRRNPSSVQPPQWGTQCVLHLARAQVTSGGVLRSLIKFGVPVVAAALALSACGGTTSSGDKSAGGKACDLKIGFFGALTGDAANLGINIKNGAELAVNQYNEKNADCKVTLVTFDSQGDPSIAPGLAQKAVTTRSSSASSAPPSPASPRPPTRSSRRPASTSSRPPRPTRRCPRTAGRPSTASSATTPPRAPPPRST